MGRRMGKHWEKTCAKHLPDRGLISKLYKELSKLNKDNLIFKMGKRVEQTLAKKRYTNGK